MSALFTLFRTLQRIVHEGRKMVFYTGLALFLSRLLLLCELERQKLDFLPISAAHEAGIEFAPLDFGNRNSFETCTFRVFQLGRSESMLSSISGTWKSQEIHFSNRFLLSPRGEPGLLRSAFRQHTQFVPP